MGKRGDDLNTAIYARKSTEQAGVADEQKSVARQIEHARPYAEQKGWTVDDASVFVDDGISGAEFANRPGFLRLMNALKPRPRFQVLVMSEESRLGREAIETAVKGSLAVLEVEEHAHARSGPQSGAPGVGVASRSRGMRSVG